MIWKTQSSEDRSWSNCYFWWFSIIAFLFYSAMETSILINLLSKAHLLLLCQIKDSKPNLWGFNPSPGWKHNLPLFLFGLEYLVRGFHSLLFSWATQKQPQTIHINWWGCSNKTLFIQILYFAKPWIRRCDFSWSCLTITMFFFLFVCFAMKALVHRIEWNVLRLCSVCMHLWFCQ